MGSPLVPVFANLFKRVYEKMALEFQHVGVIVCKIYVDCTIFFNCRYDAKIFFLSINTTKKNISFTSKKKQQQKKVFK